MSSNDRVLLAQITDLHVQVGPGDRATAERLEAVVAAVAALDIDEVDIQGFSGRAVGEFAT